VKFNTRIRYGIRTMLELALNDSSDGVFQKDIAVNQDISIKYLDHIIVALKIAGLIRNVGGKKSGYRLTRDASEITMLDIYHAFEPGFSVNECAYNASECPRLRICAVKGFWAGLNTIMVDYFRSVTLEDIKSNQVTIEGLSNGEECPVHSEMEENNL